ncbi:MAG: hypothetical protein KY468_02730 [Armatimonadetes bacterium]|nr:hypothetical protein [Armatimonadota bacterium]
MAFTPDSEALLVSIYNGRWDEGGSIYSYELWSVSTGKFLRTVARADPYSRALSDGRTLAVQLKRIDSASSTQVVTLRVYDVAEAKLLHSASHPSPGKDSNGAFISPFLRLDVKQHPPNYEATAFADMKKNVYLTFNAPDRSLQLWELTTGRLLQTFRLQEEDPDPAYTGVSAQVSLDGKTVMLKSATRVSLWRVEDGSRVANYDQEVSGMRLLTFSLDSRLMAYIESNGALAVAINPVKGGFVLGDVDTDGTVNVRDAILTLRFITELASPTPREKQAADLSGDSIISVTDVILILRKAVGLNPTL